MPKTITIPDINVNMIHVIAEKLNTLTKEYAKKCNLDKFLYDTNFEMIQTSPAGSKIHHGFKIYRVDMEEEFKTTEKYKVFQQNPFRNYKTISLSSVLNDFIDEFYPEYKEIEEFLHKFLYQHPEKATKDDFVKINTLYKKIVKTPQIPNANEKIFEENRKKGYSSIW